MFYFIKHYLEKMQWYRRWKGGKWAHWWIDPCRAYIWYRGWKRPVCGDQCARFESYPDIGDRCEDCWCRTYEDHRVVTDYTWAPTVHEEVTRYAEDGIQLCGNCRETQLTLGRKQW